MFSVRTTVTCVYMDKLPACVCNTMRLLRRRMCLSRELVEDILLARGYSRKEFDNISPTRICFVESVFDWKYCGWMRLWYSSGAPMSEMHYVNGVRQGLRLEFYANGQRSLEIPYVDDEVHGISREWDEFGTQIREVPYVRGKIHGKVRLWRRNGALSIEAQYVNDVMATCN